MADWIDDELTRRRAAGLLRHRRRVRHLSGSRLRAAGREYLAFCGNDYLNLATDARLAAAANRAARRYGTGAGASPLVSGLSPPLARLERDLAAWEGAEAALVFASGFAANLGVLTAVAGRGDAVFSDALNHASLIDGCRLSRADVHVYRHNDVDHLEGLIASAGSARRRVIVTDAVFSMDGDTAPLAELRDVACRHDALLVIDEAHATGVLGDRGTGLAGSPGGLPENVIKVGTLSKALGCQGGFVCGPRRVIDYLLNAARPYVYSTALAPPAAAAARRAVALAADMGDARERLAALSRALRRRLRGIGLAVQSGCVPIVPAVVGDSPAALRLSRRLRRDGIWVPAIRPPTVPDGTARLRVSLSAAHTEADVERLAAALAGSA